MACCASAISSRAFGSSLLAIAAAKRLSNHCVSSAIPAAPASRSDPSAESCSSRYTYASNTACDGSRWVCACNIRAVSCSAEGSSAGVLAALFVSLAAGSKDSGEEISLITVSGSFNSVAAGFTCAALVTSSSAGAIVFSNCASLAFADVASACPAACGWAELTVLLPAMKCLYCDSILGQKYQLSAAATSNIKVNHLPPATPPRLELSVVAAAL